jgi:hypothetical protein
MSDRLLLVSEISTRIEGMSEWLEARLFHSGKSMHMIMLSPEASSNALSSSMNILGIEYDGKTCQSRELVQTCPCSQIGPVPKQLTLLLVFWQPHPL